MSSGSILFKELEETLKIPPVAERGRTNQNPSGIGFWALVREDFQTHGRNMFEQGFWAVFTNRFGNWRMGQPKVIRAPATLLYRLMFALVEYFGGISLWYTVKLGRRVRIWHHSGVVIGPRYIGNDVQIRQNTTIGVAYTGRNDELPIVCDGADIGAGACIAGSVVVGRNAKIGANALVITDIPDDVTAIGNPAQIYGAVNSIDSTDRPMPAGDTEDRSASESTEFLKEERPKQIVQSSARPYVSTPRNMGRIALLGSANLDYLAMSMVETGTRYGIEIDTHVPPFGQAQMQLLQDAEESDLIDAMTGPLCSTLIVERAEDVLGEAYLYPLSVGDDDLESFLASALQPMLMLIENARKRLKGPVFVLGLSIIDRSSLGLADTRSSRGLKRLVERANAMLSAEIEKAQDVYLLDGDAMIAEVGRSAASAGEYWHLGRVPFSNQFAEHLSKRVLGALLSLRGKTARVLMIDLDNTLWGGVLGEDGVEGIQVGGAYPGSAYRAFQAALKGVSQRGVALAITSKNDEDVAIDAIANHPEMVLRPDDFVTHRINWNEKALNIQDMLDELNLGEESCMFIDDNPVEREKVVKNLPNAIVPDFPKGPEDLAAWLFDNPFLENLELTKSDLKRSSQYRVRAKVNENRRNFENVEEFYRDLQMELTFEPISQGNQQRVLQLFQKTNQFNTTTRRHDAASIQAILDGGGEVYAVGVADRFSDYELMGVIVLRPAMGMAEDYTDDGAVQGAARDGDWWVDSFLLSCRILGRTVEGAIISWATQCAGNHGAKALIGYVKETPRNTPSRNVYVSAGFESTPSEIDLGEGGLYRHSLSDGTGPLAIPDYFKVTVTSEATFTVKKKPLAGPKKVAETPLRAKDGPLSEIAVDASPSIASATLPDHPMAEELAGLFRRVFMLDDAVSLMDASMDTVEHWDSLGHLKLAMEIEQSLGVRIPADRFAGVRDYNHLAQEFAAQL